MEKFTRLTAIACPLAAENIDTDQILPARFLKLKRDGAHAKALFHDLRFDAAGNEQPQFPLNQPPWRQAKIIVAGANFGGGSSREAAVYALFDYGIRCVIAPSFGDIFSQNAAKNGLLTAVTSEADNEALIAALNRDTSQPVSVDLETQTIVCGNLSIHFDVDAARRTRLLNGWDDIDLTRSFHAEIEAFKAAHVRQQPWAIPGRGLSD
jgi:3-isopropylmalate/(R)-2-methylmalate dehydratase small subunit